VAITDLGNNAGRAIATLSITTTAAVPANALIVVVTSILSGTGPNAPTDNASGGSNTYNTTISGVANGTTIRADIFYSWNSKALPSSSTITVTAASGSTYCISAFYWDGAATAADPYDSATRGTGTGNCSNSVAFTAQLAAVPAVASSLLVAAVAQNSTLSATNYTQPTGWATPPSAVASAGGAAQASDRGGTKISSTQDTYSATLSSGATNAYAELIVAFKPPSVGAFDMNSMGICVGAE
jgi:hypothetical protein